MLRHGSLFSGFGGFDLPASAVGWSNIFHCEISPLSRRLLHYYWPAAISYSDIRKADFSVHEHRIDVLSGGFPCQPFSKTGKRRSRGDNRYLWPEMLDCVRTIQPTWVVAENVRNLLTIENGLVFDQVCSDLELEGYEVTAFVLPASGVGAFHERQRIWIVAYSEAAEHVNNRTRVAFDPRGVDDDKEHGFGTDADSIGSQRIGDSIELSRPGAPAQQQPIDLGGFLGVFGQNFPTESPFFSDADGISEEMGGNAVSKKWLKFAISGFGNAIVPQVALRIFQTINQQFQGPKNQPQNLVHSV